MATGNVLNIKKRITEGLGTHNGKNIKIQDSRGKPAILSLGLQ